MSATRHHDEPIYHRANGVPVLGGGLCLTGARRTSVRSGFAEYDTWAYVPGVRGGLVASIEGGSLDAPDYLPSGGSRGYPCSMHTRGAGARGVAFQIEQAETCTR